MYLIEDRPPGKQGPDYTSHLFLEQTLILCSIVVMVMLSEAALLLACINDSVRGTNGWCVPY